ncbi:hypothetical protein CPB84DRAFT_1813404 [Gymnopilus junonius]|uniref:Uncharacterized protein n=1 Tax=Gymnopilus junonius TaxID=109634 RepID=A0A9P5NXY2_GYMJU|nr:hypothetical protein CPB84DRAFT_1813404 [Gymnopilus junonius]
MTDQSYFYVRTLGPWPFLDLGDEVDPARIEDPDSHLPMSASPCEHAQARNQEFCWCKYPQALYPNWTPRQQKKSGISRIVESRKSDTCTLYYLDVMEDGIFRNPGERNVNDRTQDKQWLAIQEGRPQGVKVRALFAEGLSGPVLQMLGTRYNIEPFFFTSTLGWIPSRFQSHVVPHESDHITIILTFIKGFPNPSFLNNVTRGNYKLPDLVIDTQAALPLRSSNRVLTHDLLAIHMVRTPKGNTIISLHPNANRKTTTAEAIHTRVHLTGKSVYWGNIFKDTTDPTFVLLSLLWYGLYAWDESLEDLYNHICFLESQVIVTNDFTLTQELHAISAHLLHYDSLLQDFRNSILFVKDTPNPSLQPRDSEPHDAAVAEERRQNETLMDRECGTLLLEVDRLERSRMLMESRLKNVMDLEFSIINIEDSRGMQKLTEATVRDSAAMKQIAYLTMVFLPASFIANIFGMNVQEINPGSHGTLGHFFAAAVPLTLLTIWVVIGYQIQITEKRYLDIRNVHELHPDALDTVNGSAGANGGVAQRRSRDEVDDIGFGFGVAPSGGVTIRKLKIWDRVWWPALLVSTIVERRRRRRERRKMQTKFERIDTK